MKSMKTMKPMKYHHLDPAEIDTYTLDPDWAFQQKVDGIRALTILTPEGVRIVGGRKESTRLVSTTAAPMVTRLEQHFSVTPRVIDPGERVVLDGEIVGTRGRQTYWIFDLPEAFSNITPDSPLGVRLHALQLWFGLADSMPAWIRLLPTAFDPSVKRALLRKVRAAGGEGVMVKRLDSPYEPGQRVTTSLKCKFRHTVDAIVLERGPGNGHDGTGNWLRLGLHRKDGTIFEVGRCSTIGKPHAEKGDVVEVKYLYAGAGGRLVQPTHLRNRPDKPASECASDQLHFVSKKIVELP